MLTSCQDGAASPGQLIGSLWYWRSQSASWVTAPDGLSRYVTGPLLVPSSSWPPPPVRASSSQGLLLLASSSCQGIRLLVSSSSWSPPPGLLLLLVSSSWSPPPPALLLLPVSSPSCREAARRRLPGSGLSDGCPPLVRGAVIKSASLNNVLQRHEELRPWRGAAMAPRSGLILGFSGRNCLLFC